jgi:hypothetical protein
MPEPEYAKVTVSGYSDYHDGTYRSAEIDLDTSDPDFPFLRVWLEASDEQPDGGYRLKETPDA